MNKTKDSLDILMNEVLETTSRLLIGNTISSSPITPKFKTQKSDSNFRFKPKKNKYVIPRYREVFIGGGIINIPDAQSQIQFTALWKNDGLKKTLLKWIFSRIRNMYGNKMMYNNIASLLTKCVESKMKDSEIYAKLNIETSKYKRKNIQQERADYRIKEIIDFLEKKVKISNIKSVVDIGCADGSLITSLGKAMELKKNNIHGVDLRDVDDKVEGFEFKKVDGKKLPYMNNSKSFAMCLMVLHHDSHPEIILSEINRVLEKGGLFLLREHDCYSKEFSLFLDIMHGFYELVFETEKGHEYFSNYYSQYKKEIEWNDIITKSGFTKVSKIYHNNVMKSYYTLYKK